MTKAVGKFMISILLIAAGLWLAGGINTAAYAQSIFLQSGPQLMSQREEMEKTIQITSAKIIEKTADAKTYNDRGCAYFGMEQFALAEADFTKAIAADPQNAAYYMARGCTKARLREHKEAIKDLNMAIALRPNESEYYLHRGKIFRESSVLIAYAGGRAENHKEINRKQAASDLKKAIALDKKSAAPWAELARLHEENGNKKRAVAAWGQVIKRLPDEPFYYMQRAFAEEDCTLKIKDYTTALPLYAHDKSYQGYIYSERGRMYAQNGQYHEAIADYTRAIPSYGEKFADPLYRQRAEVYEKLGYTAHVIADYKKMEENHPSNIRYIPVKYRTYAQSVFSRPHFRSEELDYMKETIETSSKKIAENAVDAKLYYERGCAYFGTKQFADADDDFSKAIALDPENALYSFARGCTNARLGQNDAALAEMNTAISLKPDDAEFYLQRGKVLLEDTPYTVLADGTIHLDLNEAGLQRAINDLEKATRLNRQLIEAWFQLARIDEMSGERKQAAAKIEQAYAIKKEASLVSIKNAFAFEQAGQYAAAGKEYEGALRLCNSPYGNAAYEGYLSYKVGLMYTYNKQYEKAVAAYSRAIPLFGRMAEPLFGLRAAAYNALGDTAKTAKVSP